MKDKPRAYPLCNHPNEDHEWLEALSRNPNPVYRMSARMSWGPFIARRALHRERGPMNIVPDHEASFWLPSRVWLNADDCDDLTHYEDEEFSCWLVPEEIVQKFLPGQFAPIKRAESPNG